MPASASVESGGSRRWRKRPHEVLHPILLRLARFEKILIGEALQREGRTQALDPRTRRLRSFFPCEALVEKQGATQRDEVRFEVGVYIEIAGEQLLQQIVACERQHGQRSITARPVLPRRQTVTGSHLRGGGERQVLGIDVGGSHQAQQLGREGRIVLLRQVPPQGRGQRGPGAGQFRVERERTAAGAPRSGEVALLAAQAAEVEMCFRQAPVQCDRALEGLSRLAAPAERAQDVAQIVVESRVVRRDGKRATIDCERLAMTSQAAKRTGLSVESLGPVGPFAQRTLECVEGALPASLPGQSTSKIERRLHVTGCDGEDPTEALLRLRRSMEPEQHQTLVEGGVRRSRLEAGCLAVGGESRLKFRGVFQHQSQVQVADC